MTDKGTNLFFHSGKILVIFENQHKDNMKKGLIIMAILALSACAKQGDVGVGITAWINVIALLLLCPHAIRALKDYEKSLKEK